MFKKEAIIIYASVLYALLTLYFVWQDQAYFSLASIGLLAIYFAIFYTEWTFLSLAFLTPISVNIEEYTKSFGLFIPTEPMLFGIMLLLVLQQLMVKVDSSYLQIQIFNIIVGSMGQLMKCKISESLFRIISARDASENDTNNE